MAITLVDSAIAGSSDGGNSVTTGAVDASGADLLVYPFSFYALTVPNAPTDSEGNTITQRVSNGAGNAGVRLYDSQGGTFDASHTATEAVASGFQSLALLAFAGADPAAYDQSTGTGIASDTSLQALELTPSVDGCLLVAVLAFDNEDTIGITGTGWAILHQIPYSPGQHIGLCVAYKIQTGSAAPESPTFTWSTASAAGLVLAAYKPLVDSSPPTADSAVINETGDAVEITLSDAGCVADGGGTSGTGGFAVTGLPSGVTLAGTWSISGNVLTLPLTGGVVYSTDGDGSGSYARGSTTDDVKDAAGNYLADFSGLTVTNNSLLSEGFAAGTAAAVHTGPAEIKVTTTAPTGGTEPYVYGWERATGASGGSFAVLSDGGGVSGATTATLTDGSVSSGTTYRYRPIFEDDESDTAVGNTLTLKAGASIPSVGGGGGALIDGGLVN